MRRDPVGCESTFWASTSKDGAHDVQIVHFSFLKVAVTASRVVEGVEGVLPVVGEMSVVGLAEEALHPLVLLLMAVVLLLELTNLD